MRICCSLSDHYACYPAPPHPPQVRAVIRDSVGGPMAGGGARQGGPRRPSARVASNGQTGYLWPWPMAVDHGSRTERFVHVMNYLGSPTRVQQTPVALSHDHIGNALIVPYSPMNQCLLGQQEPHCCVVSALFQRIVAECLIVADLVSQKM